jgi:glutamate/tyrosine decarboxylase-like PLP-dependent enzyme
VLHWEAYSASEIDRRVRAALDANLRYTDVPVLGVPGSHLDRKVFPPLSFVRDSPFLSCFFENPNHIGCHTLGRSEDAFAGTQELEVDLLRICAEQIMRAPSDQWDGYVAPGGTESNIQAAWMFRNELCRAHDLRHEQVGLLFSADTHYSAHKAANLLGLRAVELPVGELDRRVDRELLSSRLHEVSHEGVQAFIVFLNMGTTMFGSVDEPEDFLGPLAELELPHRVHVDAAFGGFIYPLVCPDNRLDFSDPRIGSCTLDAHKMLQAPYGTGIHLARKGLIGAVQTEAARYVPGSDFTLCGSRSGSNAVAVWMILRAWGSEGGQTFCRMVLERTDRLCRALDRLGVGYFRNPMMNIVAMRDEYVPAEIATRYRLVPDRHDDRRGWWKIVVMEHVDDALIDDFLESLEAGG